MDTETLPPIDSLPGGPLSLAHFQQAVIAKDDPAYLSAFLAVRREWEADEARKAYNRAISDFQSRAPIIAKEDEAHDRTYARMDRIWREIRPLLTSLGLSVTWQICELRGEKSDLCHVEGQLRHRDGHGEKLVQDIPIPEIIRGQNKAQQMGSASTYARRYALCSSLGIVTGDDDDANGIGYIDPDEAKEVAELVDACRGLGDFNEKAFWEWVGATSPKEIQMDRFADVMSMLRRKLGKEKKRS